MVRYEDILYFDTESTGIIGAGKTWDADYDDFPRLVQIGWIFKGCNHSLIVYPDSWQIPPVAETLHGIGTKRAIIEGLAFEDVATQFILDCQEAKLIIGHNIYFDIAIFKAQILFSLGRDWYDSHGCEDALFKGKRIDTMRPSMKWVDARTQDGRLKFPKLDELYKRCFPGESFKPHDVLADCLALRRCLPRLIDEGLIKLEVKTYCDDENARNAPISPTKEKTKAIIGQEFRPPQKAN